MKLLSAGIGAWLLRPSPPSLTLSTHRLDLGNGKVGEKMRGTFQIHNTGSRPLEYQIQSTCGCTELTPRSGSVDPGGSQDVSLALTLPEHAGSEKSVRVLVQGNDPRRSAVTCLVTAKCPAPFEITPKFVNLGEVIRDDLGLVSEVLEIRGSGGKVLDNPGQLRLRHESQYIQINQELTADGAICLKITLSPQTPCIELYDTLELRLGYSSDRVVNVPMHARVVEPISIIPSTVFLRRDSHTGKYQSVNLLVIDRREKGHSVDITLRDTRHCLSLVETGSNHGRDPLRRFRLDMSLPSADMDEVLEVRLTCNRSGDVFVKWMDEPL